MGIRGRFALATAFIITLQTSSAFTPVSLSTHHSTTTASRSTLPSAFSLQSHKNHDDSPTEHKSDKLSKTKPLALTILTLLASPMTNAKPAFASAPVTPIKNFKPPDQKKIAMEKMREERSKIQMQEQMAHQLKCEEIEQAQGKAARAAYEDAYKQKTVAAAEQRAKGRKELLYGLVQSGICPFMDLEGERQVYLYDHGIDLTKVPTTPQQKEFMNLRRNPKLVERRSKERFIMKCIVDDLIAKGEDPLEYMENNKGKTMDIFGYKDKQLDAIIARYKSIIEAQGTLSGEKADEPFDVSMAIGLMVSPGATAESAASAAKAAVKEAKAAAKAKERAAKAAAKAEAKAVKVAAKAAKAAAKEAAKAAKEVEKAAAIALKVNEVPSVDEVVDDVEVDNEEDLSAADEEQAPAVSSSIESKSSTMPVTPIIGVVGIAGGGFAMKVMKDNNVKAEEERQRQFRMIMGLDGEDEDEEKDDGLEDDFSLESFSSRTESVSTPSPSTAAPVEAPKKKRKGLASMFSKKGNERETDLNNLVTTGAVAPEFSALLAKLLTFGAKGRFPAVKALPGGMPMESFELDEAKTLLTDSRNKASLTDEVSAEAFACVVNCMIIDIIDLASSSLGVKEKKDKLTIDALNVVMDFMDHAASLFDAVADNVVITPVTYGGDLSKSKLEQMFTIYASSMMTSLEGGITQDRIDTLQQVFNINDKKAEGLVQKGMMKNLMNMMKNPEALGEGMEGMEGMEGLSEMMAAMSGEGGGAPGFDPNGEISPEELKQSVAMMKELVDSGSVSKEELGLVRQQFQEVYGSDINDLIKAADEEGGEDELGEDGKELLDLFKTMLKEEE